MKYPNIFIRYNDNPKMLEDLFEKLNIPNLNIKSLKQLYDIKSKDYIHLIIGLIQTSLNEVSFNFKTKYLSDDFIIVNTPEEFIKLWNEQYTITEQDLMGNLTGFPIEVVNKMLERQVEQVGIKNINIFQKSRNATKDEKGFHWFNTIEKAGFWDEVINCKNFNTFFKKYPKSTLYTIDDLTNGKVAVENDGTVEELRTVLKAALLNNNGIVFGDAKYYFKWGAFDKTRLPIQSVKDFLKQISTLNIQKQTQNGNQKTNSNIIKVQRPTSTIIGGVRTRGSNIQGRISKASIRIGSLSNNQIFG